MTQTQWNGEPCAALRVTVTVADNSVFPGYWAREFVGTRRKAVRVEYGGKTFYLDDEDGSGWDKVTHGGSPRWAHRDLVVEPGSVEPRAMSDRLTVDTITSDALDALYDERDRLRQEIDEAHRRYDSRDAAEYAFGPLIDRPFRSLRPKAAPPYECAHGHVWKPFKPCSKCSAERERPHRAEPVSAVLDPDRPLIKYQVCRTCTSSVHEPWHRNVPAHPDQKPGCGCTYGERCPNCRD